jgi:hypothetical protein
VLVKAPLAVPDLADFSAVFGKITRGLILKELRRFLPPGHPITVTPLTMNAAGALTRRLIGEWRLPIRQVGEVLKWTRAVDPADPGSGLWLFLAFHAGATAVATGKLAEMPLPVARALALRER